MSYINCIKIYILKWLEHIRRLEDINPRNTAEGSRRKERPKLRSPGGASTDLQTLKIKAWWIEADDRNRWKAIITETKAH